MALHLTACSHASSIAPASELLDLARRLERGDAVIATEMSDGCCVPFCQSSGPWIKEQVGPRELAAVVAILREAAR